MSRSTRVVPGARPVLLTLALVLTLVFGWTALAHAQTSFEGQYGSPTASGEDAIEASTDASGGAPAASGGSALTASGGVEPSPGGSGSASSSGSSSLIAVLPDTGGPLLPLLALGTLALGFAGTLALRRLNF